MAKWITTYFLAALIGAIAISCAKKEEQATETAASPVSNCISSGDIIVSNSGSDVVLILDSNGDFKRIAFNVINFAETIFGIDWSIDGNDLLVAVDGSDRIVAVRKSDCSSRTVVTDLNLNGNIRGVTQLLSGDYLVVETSVLERFKSNGVRVTSGGWPLSLGATGTGVNALSPSGFVYCSTGADEVRLYDDAGNPTSAALVSGIAGTTNAEDCVPLSDGRIAVTWSGTNDTIAIYDSTLSTQLDSYSNAGLISAPKGIGERANGNLLVADQTYAIIIEFDSSLNYIGILADGFLNLPEYILVAP